MRSLILFSLLLSFGFSAQAASTFSAKNKTSKNVTFSEVRQKLKGFSAVGYYSAANRAPIKVSDIQVTAKSEAAFGFGGEYKMSLSPYLKNAPLNFVGGLVYETPRELKSINISGQQAQFAGSNPSFSMLLAYTNIGYNLTDQAMLFGGINYPTPFESDFGDISLNGRLGFQGGVAMSFTESFGADIAYRMINLTGNNGFNRMDLDGLQLQGRFIF